MFLFLFLQANPQGKARKGSYEVRFNDEETVLFSKLDQFGPAKNRAALPDPVKNEALWKSFLDTLTQHVKQHKHTGTTTEREAETETETEVEAVANEEDKESAKTKTTKKRTNGDGVATTTTTTTGTRRSKRLKK